MPAWQPALATPVAPQLSIRLVPGTPAALVIAWPALTQQVRIESSFALGAAANWIGLPLQILSENGRSSVTVPLTEASGYFRLRSL